MLFALGKFLKLFYYFFTSRFYMENHAFTVLFPCYSWALPACKVCLCYSILHIMIDYLFHSRGMYSIHMIYCCLFQFLESLTDKKSWYIYLTYSVIILTLYINNEVLFLFVGIISYILYIKLIPLWCHYCILCKDHDAWLWQKL